MSEIKGQDGAKKCSKGVLNQDSEVGDNIKRDGEQRSSSCAIGWMMISGLDLSHLEFQMEIRLWWPAGRWSQGLEMKRGEGSFMMETYDLCVQR